MQMKNPPRVNAMGYKKNRLLEPTTDAVYHTRTKKQHKLTKTLRILAIFVNSNSLNMFEAERFGDHTLRSTVSTIQKEYGLQFNVVLSKSKQDFQKKHLSVGIGLHRETYLMRENWLQMNL